MRLSEFITEGSRVSAVDELSPYVDQPNMFISLVNVNKLGINPRPIDPTTPVGIYGYPLTTEIYHSLCAKTLPFAGQRNYICLFKASGNILNLGRYTDSDLDNDLSKMIEMFANQLEGDFDRAAKLIHNYSTDTVMTQDTAGDAFWAATKGYSRRLGFMTNRKHYAVWNGVLRSLGYDGIYDPGNWTIHNIEKTQVVMLSKANCTVVKMLINDLYPLHGHDL